MKHSAKIVQYVFFSLFLVSVLVGFLILYHREQATFFALAESIESGKPISEDIRELIPENPISLTTSIVSMLVTLSGFIVTTVLNIRKDRREARETEVSLRQKEIELQKALLELAELKRKTGT